MGAGTKRAAFSFRFSQCVVVGLALPGCGCQVWAEVLAQKFNGDALVGALLIMADPQQVNVIWHEDIRRTHQIEAGTRVKEREQPRVMKLGREPASRSIIDVQRPMDEGPAAVEFRSEAWKVAFLDASGFHSLALAATNGWWRFAWTGIHSLALAATGWDFGRVHRSGERQRVESVGSNYARPPLQSPQAGAGSAA